MKSCGTCSHFNPLRDNDNPPEGCQPAGWCLFIEETAVPFWMEKYKGAIEKRGADTLASDGEECAAHKVKA